MSLSLLSSATNAQTTVDPITGQVSIIIDPATGATLNVTQNQPLDEIKNDPNAVAVGNMLGDDGGTLVQLPFTFEYYGQQFTSVYMMSNGVLSFTGQGGSFCCNGQDISQQADYNATHYNYIIAAAWSDLLTPTNENAYYLATTEDITFGWYGVYEFYDANNLNSFEIQLYNTGSIDLNYGDMDITGHTVSSGITGDLSQGQYVDLYYGLGFSLGTPITPDPGEVVPPPPDPCDTDPLSSPTCSGYQQAYYNAQCQSNALYDSGCPGYEQAYYNQQCQLNPLYDVGCNGYEQAFYNQQCSNNPLYDSGCNGYTEAVFEQNCAADPLFDQQCKGYATAIALQLAQQQQEQMFSVELIPTATIESPQETTGNPELDRVLSVLPEPIALTSINQEITQTVVVEQVAATEAMEQPTVEDVAAAEEMVAELVGETTTTSEKPNTEKQKAAVAAKIAELKQSLTNGTMTTKEIAAAQAQLTVLLAYVPGFDQYYVTIPDAPFYAQEQVYPNQQVPQNRSALRLGLASELKYDEMVQMQYNRSQ